MSSQSQPPEGAVSTALIVAMVAKGMTAREIVSVLPELEPEDIRSALLEAAELVRDSDASLDAGESVARVLRSARESSGLEEEEAVALADRETRAVRAERAGST